MNVNLTRRESQVLVALASSKTSKEIALEWHRADKTVEWWRVRLQNKLGLHDLAALTRYAISQGLIKL